MRGDFTTVDPDPMGGEVDPKWRNVFLGNNIEYADFVSATEAPFWHCVSSAGPVVAIHSVREDHSTHDHSEEETGDCDYPDLLFVARCSNMCEETWRWDGYEGTITREHEA